MVDQRRVRLSLKTRDLQRAARRLTEIEDRIAGKPRKTIADAARAFRAQHEGKSSETKRKYKRILGFLLDFCATRRSLTWTKSRSKRWTATPCGAQRQDGPGSKEVELLGSFSNSVAIANGLKNPARSLKRPQMIEANHIVPYTLQEIIAIIAACDQIGRNSYDGAGPGQ